MGKVIWSPLALDYVDLIAEFIAKDSVQRSSIFVLKIINATNRLIEFPYSGRVIPEINDQSCREIILGSYRIMYQIIDTDLIITAVINSSRNLNP